MSRTYDRRLFLRHSALLAGSTFVSTAAAAWTRPALGVPKIARPGAAKFKFSLAAYSYRNLLSGKTQSLTMDDFVRDCAAMGLEGTELTSYYFPKEVTPDYLRSLKKLCFELGLDVSGTAVGNDFGHPAGEKRQQQIDLVKRWVDYSEILGAPVIRIFAGHAQGGASPEITHKLMVDGIEECCEYAGKHGVFLALENHGGPTATADGLLKFVNDVKSPWFAVNLDTGNFRSDDVYGDLAKVAPYAVNVQVKVVVAGTDGKKQPMDYAKLAKLLRDAGYRGYVVLEYEEAGDPRTECPKHIDEMRKAFGA